MKLAIHGGSPVRTKPFPAYNTIGKEEKENVNRVLDSGILSNFLGCWHDDFFGGKEIQALEKEWAKYFGVKHAIAVNSNTSGLMCSVGAAGVGPGDEVIVSPYSMIASATTPLIYGGIPVFADIEEDNFCLDPEEVRKKITPKTKAILVVDIFGQPYACDEINAIAKEHGLIVIEDAAQAIGAKYKGKYAGALADIGVFSLNYHKHIHCGEGGIIVTDNDDLADRVRLIRNHADAVVGDKGTTNLTNMVGFNFRMTELEAAVTRAQLPKLKYLVDKRVESANYLRSELSKIPAFSGGFAREGATHAHYTLPMRYNEKKAGVHRNLFIKAVRAELPGCVLREQEGPLISGGYVKPIYLEPIFQKKIAIGSQGFPFNLSKNTNYAKGLCPVTERMHYDELMSTQMIGHHLAKSDLDDVVAAFHKVWENRSSLT